MEKTSSSTSTSEARRCAEDKCSYFQWYHFVLRSSPERKHTRRAGAVSCGAAASQHDQLESPSMNVVLYNIHKRIDGNGLKRAILLKRKHRIALQHSIIMAGEEFHGFVLSLDLNSKKAVEILLISFLYCSALLL